ncbi:class I SAM-dependent methyltransferase, partial [Streptomyces sp. SID11385]|nr:class I SAM-dependent methyltransferase [Streptomyces sp. SID11385]
MTTTTEAPADSGYADGIARLYDLVHQGKGKDYASEAADLAALITSRAPGAHSLLDVACGTGLHLEHLTRAFDTVEGVEISADMRDIAVRRNPGV